MGSSCSQCLNRTGESAVHPTAYHQNNSSSGYYTPKKLNSGSQPTSQNKPPAGSPRGSIKKDTEPFTTTQESTKKQHRLYSSKSFGDSNQASPSDEPPSQGKRKGGKKIRQEERQVEVTTVQTIKETRIIHIERDSATSGENSRIDSLPTTTDDQRHPADDHLQQQPPNVSPAAPAYEAVVTSQPRVISRDYFPIRQKTLPEELLRCSAKDSKTSSLTEYAEASDSSANNKHSSMETPYTRDCESPSPRRHRIASVATTSVMDSNIADVEFTEPTAMKFASQRLRSLMDGLVSGEVDKATTIDALSYAISVLDYNYNLKKKQTIGDVEDSESFAQSLSRASSVDNLVRDWLVQTFTRSTSRLGGPIEDPNANKKNFKSVANVIRISIMVDRFRRSLYRISIPDYLKPYFKRFCHWDFDIFDLHRVCGGHSLRFVCFEALSRFGICTRFKIRRTVMEKFLNRLEEGYCLNRNPYHNVLHGADVTQGTVFYLAVTNLIEWLSELEIFTVIIASAIHDFEHTGTTNNFHINTKSDLALFYNDRSVLENYHVSAVFRFMSKDPETNIFTGLTAQEYKEMRSLLIEIVLNTDMQFHFAQVKNMRTTLSLLDADPSPSAVTIDKAKVLSLIVHSSDVGHPGRSWPIHLKWTKMLCQEFFNQGDREKQMEMTVSPLCDRLTTNVASSQIGFIDFIVNPTFDVVLDMVERILNPIFLQHKQRSSATLLPPLGEEDEDVEEQAATVPLVSKATDANGNETQPLATGDEYDAIAKETGEPCDFIPFKWDSRLQVLKLPRFYAKNIENNKGMWRKHIEDEVNDPMFFKRFERDPVIEMGWVWPEEKKSDDNEDKKNNDNSGSENELKKLRKEFGSGESIVDEREARRMRRERQKAKIKQKEKERAAHPRFDDDAEAPKTKRKSSSSKEKHKERRHKHRHSHHRAEENEEADPQPTTSAIVLKVEAHQSIDVVEGTENPENVEFTPVDSDRESICGDLLGQNAEAFEQQLDDDQDDLEAELEAVEAAAETGGGDSDAADSMANERSSVMEEITFDDRDLDLGEYNESIEGSTKLGSEKGDKAEP